MMPLIVIGEPTSPHVVVHAWEAPSREVAQRWADEVNAGRDPRWRQASVDVRYNGRRLSYVVMVSEVVAAPPP